MVMYAKIRRMFYREHLSISEIQRRTVLSRNTIKKWLKAPGAGIAKYQRAKTTALSLGYFYSEAIRVSGFFILITLLSLMVAYPLWVGLMSVNIKLNQGRGFFQLVQTLDSTITLV